MRNEVEEIICRLQRVKPLHNCRLSIVLRGVKTSLEIRSAEVGSLARSVLGIARLAGAYGLSEVVISGEGTEPLNFPVSCLEYFGMDLERLDQIKQRAAKHQALIAALPHELIFLHAAEEPFTYLDAKATIEERLNVPLIELLGSPLSRVDSELSEKREFWLKRAVNLGTAQRYQYTHHWRGLDWSFFVDVAPLAGSEEAIAIVSDAEPWQRPWWETYTRQQKHGQQQAA